MVACPKGRTGFRRITRYVFWHKFESRAFYRGWGNMLELARMAKRETVVNENPPRKVAQIRLTVSKSEAKGLTRVTRWEQRSQNTSLELTGRD